MPHMITCRAKVTEDCYDSEPTKAQFGEDLPMSEDGTWLADPPGPGTIICDPCYIHLCPLTPSGRALTHELPAAIEFARKHG